MLNNNDMKEFNIQNYGLVCFHCGKVFLPKNRQSYNSRKSLLKRKGRKYYCCKECEILGKGHSIANETPCQTCGKIFKPERAGMKFCSTSCAASYNNSLRKVSDSHKKKVSETLVARSVAIRDLLGLPYTKFMASKIKHNLVNRDLVEQIKQSLTHQELLDYSKNVYGLDRLVTLDDILTTCPVCGKKFYKSLTNSITCSQKCGNQIISEKRIDKLIETGSTGMNTFIGDYTYKGITIRCESKLEIAAIKILIDEYSVSEISRPTFAIPYTDKDGMNRLYHPDFLASNGEVTYLIEVKEPKSQCKRLTNYSKNLDEKKEAFYEYCSKNNLYPLWMSRDTIPNLSKVYRQTLNEMKSS
jgi:hypothetical protein